MRVSITRGAAAALLAIGLGSRMDAQGGGGGAGAGPLPARRDSFFVRLIGPAQLDTVNVLMRQLEQLSLDTPAREALMKKIDAIMMAMRTTNQVRVMASPRMSPRPTMVPFLKGWIGINAEGPHDEMVTPETFLVEYFGHPSVTSVDPDSPAQRAGITAGDVLIGYNGTDLVGHRFDMMQLLVPEKKISVAVRRDGEPMEFSVTVAKTPGNVLVRRRDYTTLPGGTEIRAEVLRAMGGTSEDGPARVPLGAVARGNSAGGFTAFGKNSFFFPNQKFTLLATNGAFGAILSNVSPELAKTLKLQTGVLVNDVTDDSPASKAGLKTGDVIVSVAGRPTTSIRAIHALIMSHLSEQSIAVQVMRDKKARQLTVSW